ncbi:MAG TPA: GNAT family N-acetyltransferase [Parvibaculum sp.]|jgi:GNAT superfamily N-acetyltransferase
MNATPPIIRQATESDYEQLCDLFEELDALHRAARPDLFRKQHGAPRERSYVASLIAGPDSAVLVAGDPGSRSLYGFATLIVRVTPESGVRAGRRIVEIDNLAVRREWRRTGLGRLLISEADRWAARSNLGTVELAVHEFNADAIRFYEAVGFATSQRRMSRDLAAQD